jgi:arylformamidase
MSPAPSPICCANADKFGIDRSSVVLMGHSAGAHLSALVGSDPQYLRGAGLDFDDLSGVIPIDGAAYDVPAQMREGAKIMKQNLCAGLWHRSRAGKRRCPPIGTRQGPNAPANS